MNQSLQKFKAIPHEVVDVLGTAELNVQVLLNDNSDYDVVIGMDIINSCDFCYTNKDGKSTFSLCHPAKEKIILK